MKALVTYNPKSGTQRITKNQEVVKKCLEEAGYEVEMFPSPAPKSITEYIDRSSGRKQNTGRCSCKFGFLSALILLPAGRHFSKIERCIIERFGSDALCGRDAGQCSGFFSR